MKAILKSHFYADTISQDIFYAFNRLQYPLTELNTSQNVPWYESKIATSYGSLCPTCFYWPSSQNRITPTYLNYVGNKLYLEVQIIMYNMVRSFNGISILSIISKSKIQKHKVWFEKQQLTPVVNLAKNQIILDELQI